MNNSNDILLSIITINKNNEAGLRKTIESIKCQTSGNYEHIIIDGASTDGSVGVIREALADPVYAARVPYWHSKPDSGLYDALNEGVFHARGKYCLFLNSGDFLFDGEIVARIERLCACDDSDILYGNCLCFSSQKEWIEKQPENLNLGYLYRKSINHQNCLIKTSLQKKYPYSLEYKILGDRDFFIRAILCEPEIRTKHIDFIISKYECETGVSSAYPEKLREEEKRLQEKSFPKFLRDSFVFFEEKEKAVREELDSYEKKYHGILRRMRAALEKYTALKRFLKRKS
ncbi:MAG: glycosyltransferase [Treponema sp.]|nr:glycosyltransferase [Treponema sp.]